MMTQKTIRVAALAAFIAASLVALSAAGPGSGTATISPSSSVAAGALGTWTVVYTAAETHDDGIVRVTIPTGWTTPQSIAPTSPGYVTVATNEPAGAPGLSIVGRVITVAVDTLNAGNTVSVVYGDAGAGASARASAAITVGSYPFLVETDPLGASPAPIVASPSITVIPTTPASLDIVPNDSTATAGDFVQLHVRVLDTYDNRAPVASNRTVNLFATHGQFFDPSNHSVAITSIVIASGTNVKRVDYRGTMVAGSPHTINAFTASGSPSLGGSEFVSIVPAAMSVSQSTISATSPVVADGAAQSTVVVTSRDAFGNPRAGDVVAIDATGSATDADPGSSTNASGQATGAVANTVAEIVFVSATINAETVTSGNPSVSFVAGPVSAANSTVEATTPVVANGTATSSITVTARDAFNNPVGGKSVTLFVSPSGNAILTQPGGVTSDLGQVTGTLSSTTVGPRTVTAEIASTPVTDNAVVDFTAGGLASFLWTVDGAGTAGAFENVTLRARDALGHTVTNYTGTVSLSTTTGGVGDGVVQWDAVVPDARGTLVNLSEDDATYTFAAADNGVATLRVTDTRAETIQVRAQDGAVVQLSGNIVIGSAAADKIEVVSGGGQSATVDTPVALPPTVRVLDQFNNTVAGSPVTFTAVAGGGSVDATSGGPVDSTVTTASDGRIDCDVWRLGIMAGLNRLRARIASGSIPVVYFTATGTAGAGANLDLAPNSKSVTQGTFEVVSATLTDTFGNPKGGERVDIVIKSGLNGTLAEDPVDPGTTTALNPLARYGNTDAAGRITVRWVAPGGSGLADVLDASSAGVPQSSVVDATYTTTASGATNLRITFVGPATRPANQTFQFLVEAIDGNNNVDVTNTSNVTLTPEVGGNLLFSLTDFGATVTQVTLAAGTATVYGRGTFAGDWDITAAGGGLGADTEVVTITDAGVIDHYAVSTVAGVVAGALFDVTVEAQDVYDNRVVGANNSVTLQAYDDINPVLAQASLLVPNATLAGGRVTVAETYTKAEAIRVRASASGREGFSGIVTVSAAPAYRIAKISGDGGAVVAGADRVLTAQVLDPYDNPVANAPVTFVALQGGGTPSPPSANTDAGGQVSTTLTTGPLVDDNRVKATIGDENPPSLERVEYLVSTVPGPVASFQVTPASYSLIAGTGVGLNVTGFDANSNLVSNDSATPIQLTETGSAQFGAATGTLAAGVFNTTVVDTVAESFTITAQRQGGGASGTSAALTVSHAGAYRVTKVSGDASGLTVGAQQPLQVLVRDVHGNPVPLALVTFSTTGVINDGTFTDTSGDPGDGIAATDAAGHALVTFTTSLTAGANAVNAQILDGAPPGRERVTFTVNTVAGGIAYYTVVMNGSTVTAGQTRNATITAFDSNDNPVDDDVTQVDLSGDPGVGLVFGADPVTLTNGAATTTVRADGVQTYQVRARTVGIPAVTGLGTPVVVNPGDPAGTITATPNPATITANGVSTSTLTSGVIRDAFTNPVAMGQLINVNVPPPTNGGVLVGGSGPRAVAADGTIQFDLRSSTTPGTSVVTMASQQGSASGTVNVTFAPPPAFVTNQFPTPRIVTPGASVAFSVQVQNTATTDANLTTATSFSFSDGTRTYTANLSSAATVAGPGTQTLVFNAATLDAAFTPAYYAPTVQLVGTDEFNAPINAARSLPALSVLVTSIQITGISAPAVVSRGQSPTVTVSVKNEGAQTTTINDIDLVFAPGGGVFSPGTIAPQALASGATGQFDLSVLVDPSCPTGVYTIDAVATGDVSGNTVTDNSLAPFPLPSWQIVGAANLSYVASSMTPMSVSRGDAYQFRATISNGGAGVVSLDSSVTYIRFTDGTRTYEARPSQPYAIAGNSQQQIVFKSRAVASNFTAGSYVATFNLQGLESGAPFQQTVTSGADQVTVQTPANVASGSVLPDQVSKGSTVPFTVQVSNSGGAAVVLTPGSTEFRFAGGSFTADLDPSGPTTIPTGGATLAFVPTLVSQSITAATYAGQLVLVGTENGNPFSSTLATETVVVQNAPSLQIAATTPSLTPITADQSRPFKVRMVVANNGGADVTFTAASLRLIHAGSDRTSQFNISTPSSFVGGATLNGGGDIDTVLFDIADNTGNAMTPGMMTIQGQLEVEDVNTGSPVFAENDLGGFLQVQTPAVISVLTVLPSQPLVTQGMGRDFIVRSVVQNTGQSDVALNLSGPATTVGFSPPAGWVAQVRGALGHGGNVLSGGEVDTVLFDVTQSGTTTGTALINTNYTGTEINSNRTVLGASSGSASVLVQSPGEIVVTSVVASRATITNSAGVAWTLTVTLQNPGQSDVNLALGGAIAVTFQNATILPSLTRPNVLAGGGTLLSGGETDQIVIGVASSGTYSSPGLKSIGVTLNGTELNSNAPKSGNNSTSVTVQLQPVLDVVSVNPALVSRGSVVGFAVTIQNPVANGATATLDRLTTRLVFGSNNFNVNLLSASPVDVAALQQITLLFTPAPIVPAIPLGPQGDAVLQFRFTENGSARTENESMAGDITVQNAPALNIVSVRPSRQNVTVAQTSPAWQITMTLTNANGADVDLDLSPATTYLRLNLLGSGANVTPEYTITQPTALVGGGEILTSGETDSLIFNVTQAGATPGNVIVSGFVGGIDVTSQLPVADNTGDGGSGSFVLQSAGVLNILKITPQRPTATVGQTGAGAQYTVKMAVRNDGQAAIDLDLSAPTGTALDFQLPAGWATTLLPALVGGGVRLTGGETDTVVFNVTTTGSTDGFQLIYGDVAGIEVNRNAPVFDDASSGGWGSITLQTPAFVDILSATPSQPNLTSGAATPWDVTVVVRNTGESAARLVLPAGLLVTVSGSSPPAVFDAVLSLEEGGVVLSGGAFGTLIVHGDNAPTFTAFGPRGIGVSLDAVELNSNRAFNRNEAAVGSVVAQKAPDLQIVSVDPNLVTRGGQAFMQVGVRNADPDAATAVLNRAGTRVSFGGALYSAFLQPVSPDVIGANQTVLLAFEDKLVSGLFSPGSYDLNVDLPYTANGSQASEMEVALDSVTVQNPPQFQITGIVTSQPSVTAGQVAAWTATMTIVNNGSADVDLDLSAAKTYLRFIGPGGGFDNTYAVQQPSGLVTAGGELLGAGATDQLVFTITQTGITTGVIVISGRVEGTDVIQSVQVVDDTFDGGRGSISVVPAAAVTVAATRTSQPRVTAGQATDWDVRVIVANNGGADVDLNLAAAHIDFAGPQAGWAVDVPILLGGGTILEGGAVDSLQFRVTATSLNAGVRRIDATVPWREVNTSAIDSASTASSGFGSITVQTPVAIRITTTTSQSPNPAAVNRNQSFDVRVQVQNTGQADARDVALGMTSNGSSTILPIAPVTEVAGGQTVTLDVGVVASNALNPGETFTSTINAATDENSGEPVAPQGALDGTALVAIQDPALFDITNVRPSQTTVTRGQTTPWSVIVRVRNTGQSGAVLTPPAADDLGFAIGGSTKVDYVVQPPTAFGSGAAGWLLAGGAADSLIYAVTVTGADTGVVDVSVDADGTDRNDPSATLGDTGATTVRVQSPAGLAIATTVPFGTVNHANADRDTVNTGFAYEIHVVVDNTGEAVDSVLVQLTSDLGPAQRSTIAPKSLRRRQIDVDGSHQFEFRITAPANPVALETFTAAILPGVRSRNTGQTVTPEPPVDNRHVVVIQRRADLSMDLTSPSGAVSTNQVFTMSATVNNAGQAGVSGTAQLTLALPAGFIHVNPGTEPLTRAFTVGSQVTWQIQAPASAQGSQNFTCAISTVPNDRNTGAAAFMSQPNDAFGVAVVAGGAFSNATLAVATPAGALDGTVSAGQNFALSASVTATTTTGTIVATLSVPAGFSIVGSPTRSLGTGTGSPQSVSPAFNVIAPSSAGSGNVFVTFTGIDQNTQQPVPTLADTVAVTTVPRAALTASASVTAPPEATDNTVTIGTTFTVTANVANAPGAAGIASPGTLTIALPGGYALAGGETAAKPFTIGTPVTWQVDAPSQPSGPDQINVTISGVPPDENSGQPAQVVNGTASIAMVTEGSAVAVRDVSQALGIAVGPVPAGAADVRLLGFEIAYNVSDASVSDARIDTIAVTVVGDDGAPLGPGAVAATLARLSIDIGGAAPYEVADPATNPVVVSFLAGGTERLIAPDALRNAVVRISLDANPRATEFSVGLRSGGLAVRDAGSGQRLGVTDGQGRPLDGQITSQPLVVLSSSFDEYVHNYPNPFRAGSQDTRIAYFMDRAGAVSVRIFALDGSLVYEESIASSDARAQAGPQETRWDGRNGQGEVVRNGIYVCVLNAGGRSAKFRIAVAK